MSFVVEVYSGLVPAEMRDGLVQAVCRLAERNTIDPKVSSDGLVFPPRPDVVQRVLVQQDSGLLIVQREQEISGIGAYLLVHADKNAIGRYAFDCGCIGRQLEIAPEGVPAIVRSICIDREHYGKGLGTPMLKKALEVLPGFGVHLLGANLRGWPVNDQFVGARFFKAGFKPTGLTVIPNKDDIGWCDDRTENWGRELMPALCPIEYMHLAAATRGHILEGVRESLKLVRA